MESQILKKDDWQIAYKYVQLFNKQINSFSPMFATFCTSTVNSLF